MWAALCSGHTKGLVSCLVSEVFMWEWMLRGVTSADAQVWNKGLPSKWAS